MSNSRNEPQDNDTASATSKVRDVGTVAGARIIRQLVMVAVMAIAARVLGKELLGVWALIYIVIQFGALLSDSGISSFVVRQKDLDERLYAVAFYLSAGLALGIALIVAAIGVPLATGFGYGDYWPQFVGSSLAIIPLTITGILMAKLRRDRRFHLMFASDVLSSVTLLVGALAMLTHGLELWALVVPTIAGAFVSAAVCGVFVGIPGFRMDRQRARTIADYSLGLVGFSSVHYWARNADHVLIGRFLGAASLGVYSIAYRIMMLPLSQINATAHTVALPYLAPHQDDPHRLQKSMRQLTVAVGMLTTLPMIWVWLERELIVQLVLGDQWSGVANLLQVLAPVAILQSLVNPIGLCYQVTGQTNRLFAAGMIHTAGTVTSFIVGVSLGSIQWVVICYAIANVLLLPISVGYGLRTIGSGLRPWLIWCSPFIICVIGCGALEDFLVQVESPWQRVLFTFATTTLVAVPTYFHAYRTAFRRRKGHQDSTFNPEQAAMPA